MRTILLPCSVLLAALAGCASVPSGPPEELAPRIVALLDEGEIERAEELLEAAAKDDALRDQLYPLLYETARTRFESGEAQGSARILRLMLREYPDSSAVGEALLYALFLERAGTERPEPELVQEIGTAIARLKKDTTVTAPWVDLVQAQQAIDRGDLALARESFARFQQARSETTAELTVYIEDIGRYLDSQR